MHCNVFERGHMLNDWCLVVLSEVCADEGDELQLDLHLPRSESGYEGECRHSVCQLWLQRMRFKRLNKTTPPTAGTEKEDSGRPMATHHAKPRTVIRWRSTLRWQDRPHERDEPRMCESRCGVHGA